MGNRDVEDGMGFSGLVPSPEEKILSDLFQKGVAAGRKEMQSRAEQAERERDELAAALRDVRGIYRYRVDLACESAGMTKETFDRLIGRE